MAKMKMWFLFLCYLRHAASHEDVDYDEYNISGIGFSATCSFALILKIKNLIEISQNFEKGDENDQLVPISPRDEMLVIQAWGTFYSN